MPHPTARTRGSFGKGSSYWRATLARDEECRRNGGTLRLTKTTVVRIAYLWEQDDHGVWVVVRVEAVIVLARCDCCRARVRVLPCDILPRKLYGLAVIEVVAAEYAEGQKSLRVVAWALLGERTPAHTTIHAWTEGLGAHALGRGVGEVPGSQPHSALLTETEARTSKVREVKTPEVDERRYRSESRRERLAAVVRLLLVAVRATSTPSPRAVAAWCALGLTWGLTSPILFRTGLASTAMEHPKVPNRARSPPT